MTDPSVKTSQPCTNSWPCGACGAVNLSDGYQRCLDETGHSDCAHSVIDTPCPNDALFEETD